MQTEFINRVVDTLRDAVDDTQVTRDAIMVIRTLQLEVVELRNALSAAAAAMTNIKATINGMLNND